MKKSLLWLVSAAFFTGAFFVSVSAQEEEDESSVTVVEIYACNFADGKGYADLDPVVEEFNDWADDADVDYWGWTLLPFYTAPRQEFDYLWLGGSNSAAGLGRAQDAWLASGGAVSEKFNDVAPCAAHSAFTTLGFKMPPERDDPDNIVMSFSDCTISEGTSFSDDLAPALSAWGEHLTNAGSTAGIWVLFPAYGGGGEEFDFKYVSAFGSLEELGASWDSYNADGWEKASELFAGKVSCDSSRVYAAKNRRRLADD